MKFSENTISVLKNFSQINPSIALKEGKTLRTISPQKTVMAAALIDESIPSDAAIYDLSRFLSTVSLFEDPTIKFGSNRFTISSGRSRVNYTYASESMIVMPPAKDFTLPEAECTISVAWNDIQNVLRAAAVLQLEEIAFKCDGSTITMAAVDTKNPTADNYVVSVASDVENVDEFNMTIKVENLKLMPNDYVVMLSSAGMAHFKAATVQYWVALEAK